MGNNGSALPAQTTSTSSRLIASTSSSNSRVQASERLSPPKNGHEGSCSSRDENFNEPKSLCQNLPLVQSSQLQISDHDVVGRNHSARQQQQQTRVAADFLKKDDRSSNLSASNVSMSQDPRPLASIMTPVTLPAPSSAPSITTTGVTYTPYVGSYQPPLVMPQFPNYLPVGPPLGARYPGVESYSAMLANIGTQFQLAQEQSHLMHQSYIPSGYITLAGPHVSMPPVLLPAASQEQQVSRDRGIPTVTKTSSQDTHTVKVDGTYIPAAPSSANSALPRRSSDLGRLPREGTQRLIPSLDAVLGKTAYPQQRADRRLKVELPPPTIGIHIGTRPSNLPHHNMAIVPPLKPKSNVYMDSGESSKVVPSSLSAPMTCIGDTFASSGVAPYHKHKSAARHSATLGRTEQAPSSFSSSSSSVSQVRPFAEPSAKPTFPFASSKSVDSHFDRYGDRGNNGSGTKPWATNPSNGNIQEEFQAKERQLNEGQAHVGGSNVRASRLASGDLKRVEELHTEDFISSAQTTDGLKIDSSTVSRIEEDSERNVANISFLVGEHKAQETSSPIRSDGSTASSHHVTNSPKKKRQRFQETRTAHFEETLEDNKFSPKVTTLPRSSTVKSLSVDQQRTLVYPETTSHSEGIVTDQNRNVISSQAAPEQTKMPERKEHERWNQPPKRRWSDPIKCSQTVPPTEQGESTQRTPSDISGPIDGGKLTRLAPRDKFTEGKVKEIVSSLP
ncbi:Ataxin-1 [Apostichopus japonicus]|uniref:Ataxin-1 n=1 Tax=Stichopus japonicus TaxID=307972 RepID=A0A2G8K701_STIJA|nr:Ataxin-1 [Apostichopus japonicus]